MKRRSFLTALLCTCWIPVLFAALAISVMALRITGQPTQYVALGKVIAGLKMSAASGRTSNPGAENTPPEVHCATQMEILSSGELRRRALERVRSLHPELKEIDVEIRVTRTKGTMILNVAAEGEEAKYTRAYLDSLLDEYIAFRKELIDRGESNKMNRIIEQVLSREKQVIASAMALEDFARLNDPALLTADHERLVKEVSTLRSELETLTRASADEAKIKQFKDHLAEIEKAQEEVWSRESKYQELKKKYEDTERDYEEWKKMLSRIDGGCFTDAVAIMERPAAAVPEESQLWVPLIVWGFLGAAAGLVVMFIVAWGVSLASKSHEAKPPSLP